MTKQVKRSGNEDGEFTPAGRRQRIIDLSKDAHGISWELGRHLFIIKNEKLYRTKPFGEHESFEPWLKEDEDIKLAPSTCSELSLAYQAAKTWCVEFGFDPVESRWPEPSLVTALRRAEKKCASDNFECLVREIFEPEDGKRLTRKELEEVIKEAATGELDDPEEDDDKDEENLDENDENDDDDDDDEDEDEDEGASDKDPEDDAKDKTKGKGKATKKKMKHASVKGSVRKKKEARKSGAELHAV